MSFRELCGRLDASSAINDDPSGLLAAFEQLELVVESGVASQQQAAFPGVLKSQFE